MKLNARWSRLGMTCLFAVVAAAGGDVSGEEFITREYSVFSSPESDPAKPYQEYVTREYSVFSSPESDPAKPYQEYVTREYSVYANSEPPVAVAEISASASTTAYGAVDVSWPDHEAMAEPDVVGYRIYAETSDFSDVTLRTPAARVGKVYATAVSGLAGGQTYYVAVVAEDVGGNFDPNVTTVQVQSSVAALGEVTGLVIDGTGGAVTVSWQAPAGADDFLDGYVIYFNGERVGTIDKGATSWVVDGLEEATGYGFEIRTRDVFGTVSAGVEMLATTLLPNPGGVWFDLAGDQLVLHWVPVVPGALVSNYAVYRQSSSFTNTMGLTPVHNVAGTSVVLGSHAGLLGEHFAVATVNVSGNRDPMVTSVVVPLESVPTVVSHSRLEQTIFTGQSVLFAVESLGFPVPDYQWYRGSPRPPRSYLIDATWDGQANDTNGGFSLLTNANAHSSGAYWNPETGDLYRGSYYSAAAAGIVSDETLDIAGLGNKTLEAGFRIRASSGSTQNNGLFLGFQQEAGEENAQPKLWNNEGPSFGLNIDGGMRSAPLTVAVIGNVEVGPGVGTAVQASPAFGVTTQSSINDGFEVVVRVHSTGWEIVIDGLEDGSGNPIPGGSGTWAEVPFDFSEFTDGMRLSCGTQGPNGGHFEVERIWATIEMDRDRDGMEDDWELGFGLDPNDPADALLDNDAVGGPDGLSNLEEFRFRFDPTKADTDGDGEGDQQELEQMILTGETGSELSLDAVTVSGSYWVEVSNAQGVVASEEFVVNVVSPQVVIEEPVGTSLVVGESLDFGELDAGISSVTKVFTVSNPGVVTLDLASLTLDNAAGPDFGLDEGGMAAALAPGESTTFAVTFAPVSDGGQSAEVGLTSNDGDDEVFSIVLTGNARSVDVDNADLVSMEVSDGSLVPVFSRLLRNYRVSLPHSVAAVSLTPTAVEPLAGIAVGGVAVNSGEASGLIALAVGDTVVDVVVTSQDGQVTRTYSVVVTRLDETQVTTGVAGYDINVHDDPVTVMGSVVPNGTVEAFFEYGEDASYGSRTAGQFLTGTNEVEVGAELGGLLQAETYHYRLVAVEGGVRFEGDDDAFIKSPIPALVLTGDTNEVTTESAELLGAVDPGSYPLEVWFEYGFTTLYGNETATLSVPAESGLTDIDLLATGLLDGATYHYRIVGQGPQGEFHGEDRTVVVEESLGGPNVPSDVPEVTTIGVNGIGTHSAILMGEADANGGTTVVRFEYGETSGYGRKSAVQGIGNTETEAAVVMMVSGLQPGTSYQFRMTARNSAGVAVGQNVEFQTKFEPPVATTGTVEVLDKASVRVEGLVRARGTGAEVFVDYGTDPAALTQSQSMIPAVVSGYDETAVAAELGNLGEGLQYFYRVRATSEEAGTGRGEVRTFNVSALSAVEQVFPAPVVDRHGEVTVDWLVSATPVDGAGWRFRGEHTWREFGGTASGLVPGLRIVEYRPVAGQRRPSGEVVTILDAEHMALERSYVSDGGLGMGTLTVVLQPTSSPNVVADGGWKLFGEEDWRDSGSSVDLPPGSHVVEANGIDEFETPTPINVTIVAGEGTTATMTYFVLAEPDPSSVAPVELEFAGTNGQPGVSVEEEYPYPFVGQLRSDAGKGTGFVVRPCVVATAGHVVFDDGTLSAVTGLQWLSRRHRGEHEPIARTPRGFFLMTGYAEKRVEEITTDVSKPGEATPESQNLDVASLYFQARSDDVDELPGHGGYSGYLATDLLENPYLVQTSGDGLLKTLVGYPIDGISTDSLDRMHATPVADVSFEKIAGTQLYKTSDIRSSGGNSGGPLCVFDPEFGTFLPAAVYIGGSNQAVVRGFDSDVVRLFGLAEASCGEPTVGSGSLATASSALTDPDPGQGALEVLIEPIEALRVGAGWRIDVLQGYSASGARIDDLAVGSYTIQFSEVPGFETPAPQPVVIADGELLTATFTYEELIVAPEINSASLVEMVLGEGSPPGELSYEITAVDQDAVVGFSFSGALPEGVVFDALTGVFSGVPEEAGLFPLTVVATNAGGADTQGVEFLIRPRVDEQLATFARNEAGSYQVSTSESGEPEGLTFTASGLPAGLVLDAGAGLISGTPLQAGEFEIAVTVEKRGAVSLVQMIDVHVTALDEPPVITLHPEPFLDVEHGLGTTLVAAAEGAPFIRYQWYEGSQCNTNNPIEGATNPTLVTPPLTEDTSFWMMAFSINGLARSEVSVVTVTPSQNTALDSLLVSSGELSPVFTPGKTSYAVQVANPVAEITVLPDAGVVPMTITVDGEEVDSGVASSAIPLVVGDTVIDVVTLAPSGATRTYSLIVTRVAPPIPVTLPDGAIEDVSAVLNGTVETQGGAAVFFEYGMTASYGAVTETVYIAGSGVLPVQAPVSGLVGNTDYHFRLCALNGSAVIHGSDQIFTTAPSRPHVATGSPVHVTEPVDGTINLTFVGAVNPLGEEAFAYFEYRVKDDQDPQAWTLLPASPLSVGNGSALVSFSRAATGLNEGVTYEVRLIAQRSDGFGMSVGEVVVFVAETVTGAGDGLADAAPEVMTVGVSDVASDSVVMEASVNPKDSPTQVHFEYGPVGGAVFVSESQSIGNGVDDVTVAIAVTGLVPGQDYEFRAVASNTYEEMGVYAGMSMGGTLTFTTGHPEPVVTTRPPQALSGTSAVLFGTIDAMGSGEVAATFRYWEDEPGAPEQTASASPVSGVGPMPVSVQIDGLHEGVAYFYRLEGDNGSGPVLGDVLRLHLDTLLGVEQVPARRISAGDYEGVVTVNLTPDGIGNWRFAGERHWRASGDVAGGLTSGQRQVEFRPVTGLVSPPAVKVSVVSGQPTVAVDGTYLTSGAGGTASVTVVLGPSEIAPLRWRFLGDEDMTWKNSGQTVAGLLPGAYLIETEEVAGWNAPEVREVVLGRDDTLTVELTHSAPDAVLPGSLQLVPLASSEDESLPYQFVGQVESGAGRFTGVAVERRVIATVARAVFDEETLSFVDGVRWYHQREKDVYEPAAQLPRGYYAFEGYDAMRLAEATPQELSSGSQDLNVAVLYFLEDAARGGWSGFLASEEEPNPFLTSGELKSLIGYPDRAVSPQDRGKIHATPFLGDSLGLVAGKVHASGTISGDRGMLGGPLCVRHDDGLYYPAGLLVGVGAESRFRSFDDDVVDLFGRASVSANGGDNQVGGGITHTTFTSFGGTAQVGALEVDLAPLASSEGFWELSPGTLPRRSGTVLGNLRPGKYVVVFSPIDGFLTPADQTVEIRAGQLTSVTFTYERDVTPPTAKEQWRSAHFGDSTPGEAGDARHDSSDPDGDGCDNASEFIFGTSPVDGSDCFRVDAVELNGGVAELSFEGRAGRIYGLERYTDGIWEHLPATATGVLGSDQLVTLSDLEAPPIKALYRVRAELPD